MCSILRKYPNNQNQNKKYQTEESKKRHKEYIKLYYRNFRNVYKSLKDIRNIMPAKVGFVVERPDGA